MASWFKNCFIPSEQNGYRPFVLHRRSVVCILSFIILWEAVFIFGTSLFIKTDFLATVLPEALVDLTNDSRKDMGLQTLAMNPALNEAARLKAEDMARLGYFSHQSPEGRSPWYWFKSAGYDYVSAGENLAVHFFDSNELVSAWMNSKPHRQNILNNNFTETGIGIARGYFQGNETIFIVQLFGQPDRKSVQSIVEAEEDLISAVEQEGVQPVASKPLVQKLPEVKKLEVVNETVVEASEASVSTTAVNQVVEEVKKEEVKQYSSLPEKITASPRSLINDAYVLMLGIFTLILIINIAVKIKIQHPDLIFNGLLLILLAGSIILANRYLIFLQPQII